LQIVSNVDFENIVCFMDALHPSFRHHFRAVCLLLARIFVPWAQVRDFYRQDLMFRFVTQEARDFLV